MTMHETRMEEIAFELADMKAYKGQWRKTLRLRFEQNNGLPWVSYLRNHFDTEKVFRDIKVDFSKFDIYPILVKRSL